MATREELTQQIDVAEWGWLRAHLERGGLIMVSPDLDLVETALVLAANETDKVQAWIDAGKLAKPSITQIQNWDQDQGKRFKTLIVSPFVLVQE